MSASPNYLICKHLQAIIKKFEIFRKKVLTLRKKPYLCIKQCGNDLQDLIYNKNEMATFDIKRIMLDYSVDEKELASVLYPDNKFPERALERALGGQSKITVDQVSALSAYLGVPVYALFTDNGWYNVPDKHYSVLRKGDITAIIRSDTITIRDKFVGVEQYIARPECLTAKSIIDLLDKELAKDLL